MKNSPNMRQSDQFQQVLELPQNGTLRSQIAERTAGVHEGLRANPALLKLASSQLTEAEYQATLCRFLTFFIAAESRRVALNCFSGHSLFPDICLLSADTGTIPDDLPRLPLITDRWSCLGMLYVLHGARFGARMLQTKISAQLPDRPHHYMSQDQAPHQWRLIVLQMENAAQHPLRTEALAQSASETFVLFDQWLSSGNTTA